MVTSYEQFAAQQRAEHLNPFNRWCAVVGNYLVFAAAFAALSGRRRAGAALFGISSVAITAGHLAEGNFVEQSRVFARHPIWSVRSDVAIANETIMGLRRSKAKTYSLE
jgi:hypothetical protein